MSERGPREELAGITRGLRRKLERERAAGGGELLARSARVAASRRRANEPPAAGGSRPEEPRGPRAGGAPTLAVAGPSTAAKLAKATPAEVDLFGNPIAPPKPAPQPELEIPAPSVVLNPVDLETRAAIDTESLPVLEQVASEARGCTQCGLCETRHRAVPGAGAARSGIVFVGEAPGAEEDRQGLPFVGRAGDLLTKIIRAMDDARLIPDVPLTRETVYICNVLKCRPPENRNPLPHEVESCSPYLARQLEALKPRVICCLGKFAAELLVGAKGTIAGLRGRTYHHRGAKLIVTYHPAACLRNPNLKRPVWEDMQLLAHEYLSD